MRGRRPADHPLEQLYPLPMNELAEPLAPLPKGTPLVWVQEEPENMGAWRFLARRGTTLLPEYPLTCVSRPASACPATGSKTAHEREQAELV